MMDITQTHRLSDVEKAEIGRLVDACNAFDQTEMGIYLGNEFNFYPEMDCFFLCRDAGELVGFLCAASDDGVEAEISGCVLPGERRKGIFRRLHERARREYGRFGIAQTILKSQKAFVGRHPFVAAFRAALDNEELCMTYNPAAVRRVPRPNPDFAVRAMERADIEEDARITALAFDDPVEIARNYAETTLASDHLRAYVALCEGEIVGTASVDSMGKGWYIYGLCVDPAHQGRGYGAQLLQETIRVLREIDDRAISLRVDSDNPRALPLYQSCGFEIGATEQYFRVQPEISAGDRANA